MESVTISRAALGRNACLGALYDARTDNFCSTQPLKVSFQEEAVTATNNVSSSMEIIKDTFAEKFSKLDVNGELQASVLTGLSKPEGAASYLVHLKSSALSVKNALIYRIKTKTESLNIHHECIKESLSSESLDFGLATHIVVGITWGANSILSCQYQEADPQNYQAIEKTLSEKLKELSLSISEKENPMSTEMNNNADIILEFFGDIVPENEDLPKTFEEVAEFMKKIPNIVESSNEGRGVPLTYQLIPLSVLQSIHEIPVEAETVFETVEEESLGLLMSFFEESASTEQEVKDFCELVSNHKYCIVPEKMEMLLKQGIEFAEYRNQLRSQLADVLCSVRSGKNDASGIEEAIGKHKHQQFSSDFVEKMFLQWNTLIEKIQFAKSLKHLGVVYVGNDHPLDFQIQNEAISKLFVLYFNENDIQLRELWNENIKLFFGKIRKGGPFKYFAVDCDIHPQLRPKAGISIELIQDGSIVIENLLTEKEHTENLTRSTSQSENVKTKPNKLGLLTIPCPGKYCKNDVYYEWKCQDCKQNVEYGYDFYFYCFCGRKLGNTYEYRCADANHGEDFTNYEDNQVLCSLLSEVAPLKEMNILILGETGVGKSTWINGFVNYNTYDSLQEAEEHELCSLIPSKFTVCDEDFNEFVVSSGADVNENAVAGQSATQNCQVYPFIVGDTIIRLIDTPGIGDTRGIDQDKRNFQNILNTLSTFKELHGICILLKPNNPRLTVMFRFCIKELLTYLHRDASRNIMFCFTNSRGTSYKPGETLPALRILLKENPDVEIPLSAKTLYCYESESYRFLAAVKNKNPPVKFSKEDRENNTKSFTKSTMETKRMMDHISSLTPHPIQSTMNLNHTRELVLKLTRPLAEISKTIQRQKETIKTHVEEIMQTKDNIKELEKKAFYTIIEMQSFRLQFPRTVCTHFACAEVTGPPDNKEIIYKSVCHNRCGKDKLSSIYFCSGINLFGKCKTCGHSYNEHMRIIYERKEVANNVEDEHMKQLLNEDMTAADFKQRIVEENQKKLKEYDEELIQVETAAVQFACFLKHNAITPYNDSMLEYMEHLIKEEKNKVAAGGTRNTLDSLLNRKEVYISEIKAIDEKIKKGESNSVIKSSEVESLVSSLYALKHNGQNLQEALNALNDSEQRLHQYKEDQSITTKKKILLALKTKQHPKLRQENSF